MALTIIYILDSAKDIRKTNSETIVNFEPKYNCYDYMDQMWSFLMIVL